MLGKALSTDPTRDGDTSKSLGLPTAKLAQHPNALAIGSEVEDYRIGQVLGTGGFGITYRALDLQLRTHVAVKEYFPLPYASRAHDGITVVASTRGRDMSTHEGVSNFDWGIERYLEEARLLARIRHPNVVRVSRYFRANGSAYIVMDYEQGESLGDILAGRRTLSESQILGPLEQLLSALEVVHEQGFLHRDIKPDNLLIRSRDDSLVLIDFGAARGAFDEGSCPVTCLVTPGYSPPEQYASNPVRYGPRTDIYSLGAVLYRCVSGIVPPSAAERLIEDEMPPSIDVAEGEYSEVLHQVIGRALALRPQDRFQSVAEIKAALESKALRARDAAPQALLCRVDERDGVNVSSGAVEFLPAKRPPRLGKLVSKLVSPWWWTRKRLLAALCLAAFGFGAPLLWSTLQQRDSGDEVGKRRQAPTLQAPDLSLMEARAPVLTAPVAKETPPESGDRDQVVAPAAGSEKRVEDVSPPVARVDSAPTVLVEEAREDDPPKAVSPKKTAEAAPVRNERRDEIARLISLAQRSLDDYRLSTPPKRNAKYYFDQVLKIAPRHPEANAGYERIAGRYADLARAALGRGKREDAGRYARLGLGFDPSNAELLRLRRQAAAKQAPKRTRVSTSPTKQRAKALFSDVKKFLTEDLPATPTSEPRDLGAETTNR